MKFKGLPRDISGGLFVTSMVTAALVGIFFAGWKIAGLPFVPFDSFDWLTRVLPGRVLGFGIGIMVDVIRALHLGPTSETAKTVEHAIAITGLFVMGVAGGAILFSILRTRRKVHPVFLGLVLGIVLAVPAMLISAPRERDCHGRSRRYAQCGSSLPSQLGVRSSVVSGNE